MVPAHHLLSDTRIVLGNFVLIPAGTKYGKDPRRAIKKTILFEKVWYALMSMSRVDPFELIGDHLNFPIPTISTQFATVAGNRPVQTKMTG